VRLVVSGAHRGPTRALDALLPEPSWQRDRTHFMRSLLCRVARSAPPFVATLVGTIFAQPSAAEVAAQLQRVWEQFARCFPAAAELLERAAPDITAFASFPQAPWRQIWPNNPQESLNREVRRRSDLVGIFSGREAIVRPVGMLLAEQNGEWAVARRYMSAASLAALAAPQAALEAEDDETAEDEEVMPALVAGAG
jgi:putative transposase